MDGEERVRARRAGRFPFREPCLALPLSAFKFSATDDGVGPDGMMGWRSARSSLMAWDLGLDGIELAEDRIFRYFYVGLTANRNRAHGLTRYASMGVTTEGE